MAEAFLIKRAKDENVAVQVRSAGILGTAGMPPADETLKVLDEQGIPSIGYKSKLLTKDFIQWADLILIMTPAHRAGVLALKPEAKDKVRYLAEFNSKNDDTLIPDPIGRSMDIYEKSFDIIKQSIEELIIWLKK